MFLRFDATLNGAKFSELADELILLDVIEAEEVAELVTSSNANRPGQRVTVNTRKSLSVRLSYLIRSQDVTRRAEIRALVAKWAHAGGVLAVNYRPGLVLNVVCEKAPALDSSLKWTQALTLTLTAHTIPYWVDEVSTDKTITTSLKSNGYYGTLLSQVYTVPGTAESFPMHVAVAGDEANDLTYFKIGINPGGSVFELTGMAVPSWSTLMIEDVGGIVKIYDLSSGESYLSARTPDSSDELLVSPGSNAIYIEADAQVTVTLMTWGWYL